MTTKVKKNIKLTVNIFLWIFLVFALVMTVFAFIANSSGKDYPVIGNKVLLSVDSDSMEGSAEFYDGKDFAINHGFNKGDLIIGKTLSDVEKKQLNVGDVVTFLFDKDGDGVAESFNTHRIIKREGETIIDGKTCYNVYVTQGDKATQNDATKNITERVDASRVEAVWTGRKIAGLGSVFSFIRSSTGFLCCVVIPLAIFFVYEIIELVITINKVKGKKPTKISKEEEELIKQRAIEEYLAKKALEKSSNNKTE